ncbi:hypothetical protein MAR_001824 [Mya arenaria]|uniref:PiggyBac transposable element-derived protein domain-containing protein n=1 Tax=Mya arenaria TaxID=6604 RepID=A0ABY7FGX3_MYAAR|nr:hypothetical protein MAR_001824 [Mya arenaria]
MDRIPTRNSPYYRPDCRFRQFLEFVNRMFINHYTLRQIDSVDETLVATRGRTGMIQFIPSKAAKSAVKFWVLAESTTSNVITYTVSKYDCKTFAYWHYYHKHSSFWLIKLMSTRTCYMFESVLMLCNLAGYILHIKTYLRKTYEPSHTSLQGTYVVKSLDVHVSTHGPWLPGCQGQLFL